MGSRKKDQTAPHQPLLSSLVVRATDSGGGGGGEYEAGAVRRDPPPESRPNRYNDPGYRRRTGSVSPVRGRDSHHRFSPGFESSGGASRNHGLANGKESGRYRDYSPPYGRGRDEGRIPRNHDQFSRGPGPLKVEGLPRNNPNIQPREGDWICSDPYCKNLNFARREQCYNCSKPRHASSPRRGYLMPPFDHSSGRIMNGRFRSPPRVWPREASRDLRVPHEFRFPVPLMRGDYLDRYERPVLPDWGHRDTYFDERRDSRRRVLSPPPAAFPSRGCVRDRSRSPIRGEPKEYRRDVFVNRIRDGRRGAL